MGEPQLGELEAGFGASRFASAVLRGYGLDPGGRRGDLIAVAAIAAATSLVRRYEGPRV